MSAVDRVAAAWTIPGRAPAYHLAQQQRLRQEWPMLYNALVDLVVEQQGNGPTPPTAP